MANRVDRMLGVLGGLGPLAGAQFMLRLTLLTPATCDQEHIPTVLWSDPRVPDRTGDTGAGAEDPLPWLLRGIEGLQCAGCGAIAIPCSTAHRWFDAMRREASVPIIHIVDAAGMDLSRLGIPSGTIGIMGTQTTLDMHLYQERLEYQGWRCIIPSEDEMDRLVGPAIALVKANRVAEAFQPLSEVVNTLAARGATAVVLGCTEMPLGIQAGPADGLKVPVVDTIDALARAAIRWARS